MSETEKDRARVGRTYHTKLKNSDFIQEIGEVEIGSMHIYGEPNMGQGLCWVF